MDDLGWGSRIRRATSQDEGFLFDVYCTTWQKEIAAMPNPNLVQHFLRIQYTAHNVRLQTRFPDHERWVVTHEDKPAGRLFLHRSPSMLHIVEITLLPEFCSAGIGSRILRAVLAEAARDDQAVSLRVPRRNVRAANLYNTLGFRLVALDDQDSYF